MPTTAGSGAEATGFSVVYFGGDKYSFLHKSLIPDFVIGDVALIKDAPHHILASSAMDALAQAVESYWSVGGTDESRAFAKDAITLTWNSVLEAINARNVRSMADLIRGSNLAGRAINISKTTGNHALSYKITTDHGIPHGHCVGMLLPRFVDLHLRLGMDNPQRAKYAIERQSEIFSILGYRDAAQFSAAYAALMDDLGLEQFDALNKRHQFDAADVVSSVNVQRLGNHPITLTSDEMMSIFD